MIIEHENVASRNFWFSIIKPSKSVYRPFSVENRHKSPQQNLVVNGNLRRRDHRFWFRRIYCRDLRVQGGTTNAIVGGINTWRPAHDHIRGRKFSRISPGNPRSRTHGTIEKTS